MTVKKIKETKMSTEKDEYAEVPEQVLDASDLKELEQIKSETEVKKAFDRDKDKGQPVPAWKPKTKLGEEVKSGKIKDIDEILKSGRKILEAEIADHLLTLKSDLISIGQSKGKFGEVELNAGTEMVMPGDNTALTVKLIQPIAMEKGLKFAMREGGRTVGAGQVTEIVK